MKVSECHISLQMEETCGAYTHKIVKPMLSYLDEVSQKIKNIDNEMELKNTEIRQLEEKVIKAEKESQFKEDLVTEIKFQVEFLHETIKSLMNQSTVDCQSMAEIKKKVDETVENLSAKHPFNFNVLYDSEINGPGWIVIQQRFKGNENFYRDWATYREGFGTFDGDFFLGLEKIHRITREKPYELYVHMDKINIDGTMEQIQFARYDEFAISGEEDNYRLIKLGKYSGNASDHFGYHRNATFSTYDRDNDEDISGNCAAYRHGGWWHKHCASW